MLRGLLDIKDDEDMLDLGCGPGNITREMALATRGSVVGGCEVNYQEPLTKE